MTWSKHISISCDESGCGEDFFSYDTENVFDAETEAIEEGWKEEKGDHYCPECKNNPR
jgi:hypothetical protein